LAALNFDWGVSAFVQVGVTQDEKDVSMSYLMVAPAEDVTLPLEIYDQNCGKKEAAECKRIKDEYIRTMNNMFCQAGFQCDTVSREYTNRVFDLEHALAHITDDVKLDEAVDFEMIPATAFDASFSGDFWDFGRYMSELGKPVKDLGKVAPLGMSVMQKTSKMLATRDVEDIKAFMAWQTIKTYAPWLDSQMRHQHDVFFINTLMGQETLPKQKERAQILTESILGMEVGTLYSEAYFSQSSKIWGMDMTKNLIKAFKNAIKGATWITTDQTRNAALLKAENFLVKLGAPDQLPDHSALFMVQGNVVESMVNANRFYFRRLLDEVNAPTDFTEWGMTPQSINAYYNPRFNEFVIPAGIFQKPFFDVGASAALNYGSMGAVIGHEMTHSVDANGRKYDWKGNRADWSTPEEDAEFDKIALGLVAQANSYRSHHTRGYRLNGEHIKNEMVADNGGVQLAWDALKHSQRHLDQICIDGFDEKHRFWYSWARNWAANSNKEFTRQQIHLDDHPPADFRVNGVVSNFIEWREMFQVEKTRELYKKDKEMVNVWPQDNTLDFLTGNAYMPTPLSKRGVRQPHPFMDGQADPGRPTHENGRKRHHGQSAGKGRDPLVNGGWIPTVPVGPAAAAALPSVPLPEVKTVKSEKHTRTVFFTMSCIVLLIAVSFIVRPIKKVGAVDEKKESA